MNSIKFEWDENKNEINKKKHSVSFEEAKTVKGKPTLIVANTTKGCGVSFMENKAAWHHKVPTEEEYQQGMAELKEKEAAANE